MNKRSGQSGTVVKKGKFWHLRYLADTPEGRIRKSQSLAPVATTTKTEAKLLGRNFLDKLGVNTTEYLARATAPVVTFATHIQRWKDGKVEGFKPSGRSTSLYVVNKHIIPRFGSLKLEQVDKQAVQVWINELVNAGTFAPKTIRNMVKLLKQVLNWSDVKDVSSWRLSYPELEDKEQRWFMADEVDKLIAAAKGKYKVLFRLAYATGMRAGELFGLHVEDIDFVAGVVHVRRSTFKQIETTPKTKNGRRTIFLDSSTLVTLKEHLAGRTTGRVFETNRGTSLEVGDVVHRVLGPLCEQVGIPRGGMHAFRHGRVSKMVSNGVPEKIILQEVGHSKLNITHRYTHFEVQQRRNLAESLSQ